MSIMLKGIDVSCHQKDIEWEKTKNEIQFAIIRAGYGKDNVDEKLVPNANACMNYNIPMGLYWFSYAYSVAMAEFEAECVIRQAKKYKIDYPIAYDAEYDTAKYCENHGVSFTRELCMELTLAFCNKVKEAGYQPAVYTNKDFANRFFDVKLLKSLGIDIWYAYYNKSIDRTDIEMWQYTSKGKVSGISGNVDMNYSYKDYTIDDEHPVGWVLEGDFWRYYLPSGDIVTSRWYKVDGLWYYFDPAGVMKTGWLDDQGKWYFLNDGKTTDAVPVGAMLSNMIINIEDPKHGIELYVFADDGHMLTQKSDRGNLV